MKAKEIRKILNESLKKHGYKPSEVQEMTIKQVMTVLGLKIVKRINNINLN